MKNEYYDIAINDLKYLQCTINTPFYNNMAAGAQQVVEKMLKSVAELCDTREDHKVMNGHNLRGIYQIIKREGIDLQLNPGELAILKDVYYESRYPGDSFTNLSAEDFVDCLHTMYEVIRQVNRFRKERDLYVEEIEEIYPDGMW